MKVTSDTDARLVLVDKPWLLGVGITLGAVMALGFALSYLAAGDMSGAVMAALAFAMCLAAFTAFVRRIIVFLDRASGRVVVRVASVFGTTETGVALADVARAEVDTKHAMRTKGRDTHRPVLRLREGGTLALSQVFISGGGAESVVAHINGWLGRRAG